MPNDRRIFYSGTRTSEEATVSKINDRTAHLLPLGPSLLIANHSPDGFEWGYAGSGPAQLAIAILLDATDDPTVAREKYSFYMFQVISKIKTSSFVISLQDVLDWVGGI